MSYIIGQYNHPREEEISGTDYIDFKNGIIKSYTTPSNMGTVEIGDEGFKDICLQLDNNGSFNSKKSYYLKCYIKQDESENKDKDHLVYYDGIQNFSVQLIKFSAEPEEKVSQYIKSVRIEAKNTDPNNLKNYVTVECIFTPVIDTFDTILFQLIRVPKDYVDDNYRTPRIAFQELGEIKNILPTITDQSDSTNFKPLLKLGIQSRPGLRMCINQEEIHTSRSGIYEIRNGIIPVDFFSIVSSAKEVNQDDTDPNSLNYWLTHDKDGSGKTIESKSFTNTQKVMTIDAFTLDYMYEKE